MAQTEKQLANLKRGGLTSEEARRMGKNGGKKSVEVRREKKRLREILELMLQQPAEKYDGTNAEAMSFAMMQRAIAGDTRAYEIIRDTIGEKPVEKRDVAMQAEVALTNEQRAAVYRLALQAAMSGESEDDLK